MTSVRATLPLVVPGTAVALAVHRLLPCGPA